MRPRLGLATLALCGVLACRTSTPEVGPEVAFAPTPTPVLPDPPEQAVVIVLHGLEKPGNVGAILRSADAAGAHAVLVLGRGADPYGPNVIRASQITDLPLINSQGRNFQVLYKTLPGFTPPTEAHSDSGNPQRSMVTQANGMPQSSNNTKLDGATGRPDFTFTLPKGHELYMDVKFPLAGYLRFLDATYPAVRPVVAT